MHKARHRSTATLAFQLAVLIEHHEQDLLDALRGCMGLALPVRRFGAEAGTLAPASLSRRFCEALVEQRRLLALLHSQRPEPALAEACAIQLARLQLLHGACVALMKRDRPERRESHPLADALGSPWVAGAGRRPPPGSGPRLS